MSKFSASSGMIYPDFSETEKVVSSVPMGPKHTGMQFRSFQVDPTHGKISPSIRLPSEARALPDKEFSDQKFTICRLASGLRAFPLGELTALPRPPGALNLLRRSILGAYGALHHVFGVRRESVPADRAIRFFFFPLEH